MPHLCGVTGKAGKEGRAKFKHCYLIMKDNFPTALRSTQTPEEATQQAVSTRLRN